MILLNVPWWTTSFSVVGGVLKKWMAESGYEFEEASWPHHVPTKTYDRVVHVNSITMEAVSAFYRYMWWTRNQVFYGVCEGRPVLSYWSLAALNHMRLIVPSQYVKWELEGMGIRVDDVIPHGIELDEFENAPRNNRWRELFGDKIVVLTVGHRNIRKGHRYLIEAWNKTRASRDPNVLLVIHSDVRDGSNTENVILPCGENVFVTNQVGKLGREDIIGLFKAADLYVQPSLAEGFGLPIVEAMAAGVPTMVLDAPPMNEHVRQPEMLVKVVEQRWYNYYGVMHFRLNIPDIDDFAEKLDAAIYDEDLRRRVAEEQLEDARRYDYRVVYKRWRRWLE